MKLYHTIRKLCIIYLCISIQIAVSAQGQSYIDSILSVIHTQTESEQIQSYIKIFKSEIESNIDRAKIYLDSAILISERYDDISLIGSTANNHAIYLTYIADYEGAIIQYDKALEVARQTNDKDQISKILNNKALTLSHQGRMRESIENHIEALQIKEQLKTEDPDNLGIDYWDESIAASYWNLASLHSDLQNFTKGNEYYYKALEIYNRLDLEDDIYGIKSNLALNLIKDEHYAEGIALYKECEKYMKSKEAWYSLSALYGNLSKAYIQTDSLDLAQQTIDKAFSLKDEHNDISLYGLHRRYEGDIMMKQKKYRPALTRYEEALSIAKQVESKRSIIMGHLKVSEALAALGFYKKAYDNRVVHDEIYEEVLGKENHDKINELEVLYQTERKEKELIIERDKVEILKKEAEVGALQRWLLGLGLLIVLVSSLLGWYNFRQRAKLAKQEKALVDAELEFKKKELTTHALHLAKKNEMLEGLKNKAQELRNESEEKNGYRQLIRTIDFDLEDDNNWENFASYFEQVHKDFNKNVVQKYPEVTPNELRLISLVKMNLSIKEMANILNISVAGVKKARQRLRKKMNLSTKDSLEVAVLGIE